jgi:predicted small integral membrane protein
MALTLLIRVTKFLIALMPAFLGLFAVLNNTSDYEGTFENVLSPIMCMKDTFHNPAQTWRSLCYVPLMHTVFILVIGLEAAIGLLGLIGAYQMARVIKASPEIFREACRITSLACLLGIMVWGLGFFVVIGDWFLVWQGGLKPFRTDGLVYSGMMIICLLSVNYDDEVRLPVAKRSS